MYVYYRGTSRPQEIDALSYDKDVNTPTGVLWLTDGKEPASRYGDNLIKITLSKPLPEQYKGIAEHELGNHREWAIPCDEWNDKLIGTVEETEAWYANGNYVKEI